MTSLQGAGAHRFWGFSPALDLLAEAPDVPADADAKRFLLLSPGDPRHILRTLGALSRLRGCDEGTQAVEFSVYEQIPELLARHLLMLSVALDFELPRRERAELLLELLANSLLREKTAAYLAARADMLCRVVSDGEGALAPLIDLSLLKMRDRDALHDVLRTWGEDVPCDMVRLRDERLRGLYKDRYDMRRNVLDWDYTMGLQPLAPIVHKLHFREWRQTGIAFELRDSAYVAPNRSLISMAAGREKGRSVLRRGFWGDVANSPFAAVGVECDEPRLFKMRNEQQTKTACDVAYYNVLSWLTEMETGKPYELREEDVAAFEYGASVATPALPKGFLNKPAMAAVEEEARIVEEAAGGEEAAAAAAAEAEAEAERAREVARKVMGAKLAKLPRFRLRLLSGDWGEVVRKPRHQKQYALLAVGSHYAHLLLDARVNGLLAPRARALVETAKFVVEVHKSKREAFAQRALELAALLGWSRHGATAAPALALEMGSEHPAQLSFGYDEETAPTLAAEVRRLLEAEGKRAATAAPLELTDGSANTADGEEAISVEGPGSGIEPHGAAGVAGMLGSLAVAEDTSDATAEAPAAPPAEPAKPAPAPALDPAIGKSEGRVCAITGLPAKYKDPQTGLAYANLDAYKEIRRLHPAPAPPPKESGATGADGEEADGDAPADPSQPPPGVPQRPIVISSGPCGRRINKVA